MPASSAFQALEWQSLLRQYSSHCLSAPGKERALVIEPCPSPDSARDLIELTSEAIALLDERPPSFLSALELLDPVMERLLRSSLLDGKELLLVARSIAIADELRLLLSDPSSAGRFPRLHSLGNAIPRLIGLVPPVLHAIDEQGGVRDTASPALRALREQERRLHSEARERVEQILQQGFRDGFLQERYFDVRDGKYLIPVKSEFRGKVDGFVMENSSSRASVFMEPAALRGINDRIRQTQLLIEEEVYRILLELSQRLHPKAPEIRGSYELSVELDLHLGRGALARSLPLGASKPEFAERFRLEGLYHPLLASVLEADRIIRNDFLLGPDRRVMVISGPNTGGKTVLLKAVGLCSLMARSGFHLPCSGPSLLPWSGEVLAQIGDSQNLELSLSSFSGSIRQLCEMLEQAREGSLVLVDEILHATDPDEATALSRAILEELAGRGAFAIVTTHLNGLKSTGAGVFESASMEFDPQRLTPTYRLRVGVPGSSRALEIATKLGLPGALIDRARGYFSVGRQEEQRAVDQLEARERELLEARQELQLVRAQLERERQEFSRRNQELEQQKRSFRSDTMEKIRDAQRDAAGEAERLIADYKKRLASVDQKHQAALESQAKLESLRQSFQRVEKALEEAAPPPPPLPEIVPLRAEARPPEFAKGQPVHLLHLRSDGILLSDPSERARPAEVLAGGMRMKVRWEQLEPRRAGAPAAGSRGGSGPTEDFSVSPELHLIGKTVDEAVDSLSAYMDRAARSGRAFVRIVHGHGSGALKKAVRDFLKKSRYEMSFRAGAPGEGGEGCTVVEFR